MASICAAVLDVLVGGKIRPRRTEKVIYSGRRTTCAQIIHIYAPEIEFYSLAIFLQKLRTSLAQLLAADLELTGDQFYDLSAIPDDVQIFTSFWSDISNSYAASTIAAKAHKLLSVGRKTVSGLY